MKTNIATLVVWERYKASKTQPKKRVILASILQYNLFAYFLILGLGWAVCFLKCSSYMSTNVERTPETRIAFYTAS